MAPKQREGRPHKKQHNQKSIADLWQPLVTEKEKFDQEQRITEECREVIEQQAFDCCFGLLKPLP
jgi:hypothetical protein